MAFELETTRAKLIHLNPRPEKHGEENVPACDLKVQVQAGSEILSMIHPTLRAMLYKADEHQGQIEEAAVPTVRRFGNLIERLRLGVKLVGASVVIGFGLGGAGSDIELETVDVDGFSADLMEGRQRDPDVPHQGHSQRRTDEAPLRSHGRRNRHQHHARAREAAVAGPEPGTRRGITPRPARRRPPATYTENEDEPLQLAFWHELTNTAAVGCCRYP